MDWANIAPMVVGVVMTLTVGGVLILRPISKRVSDLLELYAREKSTGPTSELRHMRDTLETLDSRLRLIEERQDFTDKLLGGSTNEASRAGLGHLSPLNADREAEG